MQFNSHLFVHFWRCRTHFRTHTSLHALQPRITKHRWALLVDDKLHYYGVFGDPKPKQILDLKLATAVTHPDDILEMVSVQMPDKLWQFKAETVLLGGEWWWKLRQVNFFVLVCFVCARVCS